MAMSTSGRGRRPEISDNTAASEPAVEILTPMTLCAGSEVPIFSPDPILVRIPNAKSFKIVARGPIIISMDDKIQVESAAPLDSRFAAGWNRLPAELKVRILEHALVLQEAVEDNTWYTALRPYLQMTPEIAELSKEIFYTKNSIRIYVTYLKGLASWNTEVFLEDRINWQPGESMRFRSPKTPFKQMIRTLEFVFSIHTLKCGRELQRLADSLAQFPNVQFVSVHCKIEYKALLGHVLFLLESLGPDHEQRVVFPVAGKIVMLDWDHDSRRLHWDLSAHILEAQAYLHRMVKFQNFGNNG